MDYEVLQTMFDMFDMDCYLDKAFYCSEVTYPVYIPEITWKYKLKFVFVEELTKEEIEEFIDFLSKIDTEE